MLLAIVGFELRRRLKMFSTYVYAAILFGAGLFMMLASAGAFKSIAVSGGAERVWANGPHSVYGTTSIIALLGLFTVAAVFGQAAYQDFGYGTWPIIFTKNLRKASYLGGRFLGAWLFSCGLFLFIGLGQLLGALLAQLLSAPQLGPHRLDVYLWPFVTSVWPMLFFCGAVFFALASLTRQMAPVYVGVVVLVMGYFVLSVALGDVQYQRLAAWLDPFGFNAFEAVTRYATPAERNRDLVPFTGALLGNRLLWTFVGAAVLGFVWARFRPTVAEQGGRGSELAEASFEQRAFPRTEPSPRAVGWVGTALGDAWLFARDVFRSPVYWSFALAGLLTSLLLLVVGKSLFGTATLPVTYQVLELVQGGFVLFTFLTIAFYAGELLWKERDAGLSEIVDAGRTPTWVLWASKLGALFLVALSFRVVQALAALGWQLSRGFFDLEPGLYVTELFFFGFFADVLLCVLAFTLHVVVNHKYLGHGALVLFYVSRVVFGLLGVEERLVRFGSEPSIEYSDMNGYGHWVGALLLYRGYWYAVAGLLVVVAALLFPRGRRRSRLVEARARFSPSLRAVVVGCGLLAAGLGGYLYYRTHVKAPYRTAKADEQDKAAYEKAYRGWLERPQPKVVDVEMTFEVFPAQVRLRAAGTYLLKNKTDRDITEVFLNVPNDARFDALSVGGVDKADTVDERLGVRVFKLASPLSPGAETKLLFDFDFQADPLVHRSRRENIVENGTFFDNFELPIVGYYEEAELAVDAVRERHGLAPKERMRPRDDPQGLARHYLRADADFVTFRATVSTAEDQVAIAPGYLKREWREGGRRYFRYEMDQPMHHFFSVLSARYEVLRDEWQGVKLEIYFHPTHRYNLARMMQGMKDALAYSTKAFGPYQHKQARIIEFPRYRQFAQAFPNTIPYSEGVGFIARVREGHPDDLDYPYYVTAHEIAHQWWAHQVAGANVRGATATSETLAQYTALMVMKERDGAEKMRKFLKYELDQYLIGRVVERKKELPLAQNENQPYIHYQKGSLAMYALQDFIGEDRVNRALRRFVEATRFQGPPYPTAKQLVDLFRDETPAEFAYLIDDLFESITLYDNRVLSASMKQGENGWNVTLKVKAVKYRADESGNQTELDFNDWMDVGALGPHGEALLVEKRRVAKGESELRFTVPKKPAQVGIDPLNKLVDRNSTDNVTSPTEG